MVEVTLVPAGGEVAKGGLEDGSFDEWTKEVDAVVSCSCGGEAREVREKLAPAGRWAGR